MTRVAKARRRADALVAGARVERGGGPDYWNLGVSSGDFAETLADEGDADPAVPQTGTNEGEAGLIEESDVVLASTLSPEIEEHFGGLVRRIFLPPPVGAGARTVLFCGAGGGRDTAHASLYAAGLLARHAATNTVCLVDTQGAWADAGDGGPLRAPDRGGPAERLFRLARPLDRDLWNAPGPTNGYGRSRDTGPRWFSDLCSRFEYVIVDAAATSQGGEPNVLAPLVCGVVLVVDEGETRRESARTVAETLSAAGARLLGVVLTNRTYPIPAPLYDRL